MPINHSYGCIFFLSVLLPLFLLFVFVSFCTYLSAVRLLPLNFSFVCIWLWAIKRVISQTSNNNTPKPWNIPKEILLHWNVVNKRNKPKSIQYTFIILCVSVLYERDKAIEIYICDCFNFACLLLGPIWTNVVYAYINKCWLNHDTLHALYVLGI